MHRVRVKICGLREERDVVAAAVAGADYLGFVMAPSRRRVSRDEARVLVREARLVGHAVYAVGVFVGDRGEVRQAAVEEVLLREDRDGGGAARCVRPGQVDDVEAVTDETPRR